MASLKVESVIDVKIVTKLVEVEIAYTPDGINVGWDEFNSIEDAMQHYNIELKPIEDEEQWDVI